MAQYNGNYTDENGKPVEGAEVFVYTSEGDLATITDTNDVAISSPIKTDQDGNFAYRAVDGFYQHVIWFGGRKVLRENNIFIGDPNLSLAMASEQVAEDAADASESKDLARAYAISDTDEPITGAESETDRGAKYYAGLSDAARAASVVAKQGAEAAQATTEGLVDDAESAAIASAAAGGKYATTGDGEADTVDGDFFVTPVATGLAIWENVGGTATAWPAPAPDQKIIATADGLASAVADVESAAATVGIESGNPNARVAFGGIAADTVSQRTVGLYGVREKALVSNRLMSVNQAKMWRNVRFIGHSAVQGSGVVSAGASVNPRSGINGSIPRHLEYLLQQYDPEWCVSNRGQSAQTSAEIASRMGAIPINITLASGTTLASSGAVTCTCTPGSFGPSSRRGTSADDYYGKIGSQACILRNTGTGGNANTLVYTIEQSGGTGSITVNPGTPFILDPDPQDYAVNIFWATRNDNNNQLSWDMQGAMVEKLPQDERRFVVMGDWNIADGTEDTASTRLTNVLAENAELRNRYQGNFFDVRAFLRGEYPYDGTYYRSVWQMTGESANQAANDYSTAGDWVTNGRIPRRWMSIYLGGADSTHFNEQTYYWLAQALIEFHFVQKGWLL